MHQLIHEGEQQMNAINKGLKHADAAEKIEAAAQNPKSWPSSKFNWSKIKLKWKKLKSVPILRA